jgi:type II secretory pathway pseudopilin PulG
MEIVIIIVAIGLALLIIRAVVAVRRVRSAARNNPYGAAIITVVELSGYYDGTPKSEEAAIAAFRIMNEMEGNDTNDSRQYDLYRRTLKTARVYIPLVAAYAIAAYADPNRLGINVNSPEEKMARQAFSALFPEVCSIYFIVKDDVKFDDYDKVVSCMWHFINYYKTIVSAFVESRSGVVL